MMVLSAARRERSQQAHDDLAARHAFAYVVLRFALEGQLHPVDVKDTERLPRGPGEVILNRRRGQPRSPWNAGNLAGQPRAPRNARGY
jgi:hypothetical protein